MIKTTTLKTVKGALKVALLSSQALSPIRAPTQCLASCTLCLRAVSIVPCPLRLLTFVKHLSQGAYSPRYAAYIHSASVREWVGMILRKRDRHKVNTQVSGLEGEPG